MNYGTRLFGKKQGYIQTIEGNIVHYGYVEKFIEKLGKRFNIRKITFDRWGAVQVVQNLECMCRSGINDFCRQKLSHNG